MQEKKKRRREEKKKKGEQYQFDRVASHSLVFSLDFRTVPFGQLVALVVIDEQKNHRTFFSS